MTDANRTQPLPTNWHWTQDRAPSLTVVRTRYPRTAASVARTVELPVVGRAGTRECVLAGDAMFGGGECR